MNKQEFLESIRKQIHFVFDRDSIELEYIQHIEDSVLDLMEDGYSKEEAENIAIERMGDPIEIGKQLNEEHKPLLGWAWFISKVIVILLILPTLMITNSIGRDIYRYLWPIGISSKENTIKIDETFDFDAHTVTIDKILKENGSYCITYHAMAKLDVNRTGVVDYLFHIKDENGNILDNPEESKTFYNTIIGCQGEKWFNMPKNKVIYVSFTNGEIFELDIKEYQYE